MTLRQLKEMSVTEKLSHLSKTGDVKGVREILDTHTDEREVFHWLLMHSLFDAIDPYNPHLKETVEFLLKRGAKANAVKDTTTVHLAVEKLSSKEALEIVPLLHQWGASVSGKNARGETPPFVAVKLKDFSLLEMLVNLGADVDETSRAEVKDLKGVVGRTPLDLAVTDMLSDLKDEKRFKMHANRHFRVVQFLFARSKCKEVYAGAGKKSVAELLTPYGFLDMFS